MTKAHLEKLFALTRGAAVLGIGLGGAVMGCDHAGSGDAPIAPATIAPLNATAMPPTPAPINDPAPAASSAASPSGSTAPVPTHRIPIPNAMRPRPDLTDDAGSAPKSAPRPPG